jgi:hypothetical protein
MISTKEGSTLEKFKTFIKDLPDGGKGYQIATEGDDDQAYITTLTYEDAMEIAKKPFRRLRDIGR